MKVVLSDLAQADFNSILEYTLVRWGERQVHKYNQLIQEGLNTIAENPKTPFCKKIIRRGKTLRYLRVEKHHIYYSIEDEFIFVNRILHAQMNPELHL